MFAFFFAPAGAVLGHLALGQHDARSRDRALVGVTLSYTFLVTALVAGAVWAVQGRSAGTPPAVAAPVTTTAATTSSSTPPPPPPPPTVAPADLSNLFPSIDEVRNSLNVPDMYTSETRTDIWTDAELKATFDPDECRSVTGSIPERIFQENGYQGFYGRSDETSSLSNQFGGGVAAFPDASSARRFTATVVDQWHQCAGRRVTQVSTTDTGEGYFDAGNPLPENAITLLRNTLTTNSAQHGIQTLAIAAKSNVMVVFYILGPDASDQTSAIAQRILDRIPS
ncbi:sensor domain-containing protein [Mycobacterium sp. M1]|uniref:Sensor domain-containing protein n=1 Tax=Mycolicibacter acidiphilus TaxID=2835306 RepID=A0ABS5RGL2_9MYCO|nr:sensor domain-containing protein [Mycolicibacter acidiphilus]MBS9533428.1 sensor domain-containing protein [Mycolicibacter acidiphilus]